MTPGEVVSVPPFYVLAAGRTGNRDVTAPPARCSLRPRDLPAGQYRARCAGAADVGDDPAPFLVQGAFTEVVLEIRSPRTFPVYVRLFEEYEELDFRFQVADLPLEERFLVES